MVSLDPDGFLADVSDYSRPPFPAGPEPEEEEEELEWLSNKDSFPEVETCMLTPTPQSPPAGRPVQARKTLPPMPTYPTKKAAERIVCKYCSITQTLPSPQGVCNICGFVYKSGPNVVTSEKKCVDKAEKPCSSKDGDRKKSVDRKCTHCGITKSPLWREGPLGRKTLCNACGVRYKSGRLCAEYRPLNSPTYCKEWHSNAHRKVLGMRKQNCGLVEEPVNACIKNAATKKSKKHLLPAVPTVSVFEQPRRSIITEQHSPVLVLENSTNSTTTYMSFCETLKQQLFCNEPNDKHIREDTAKLEIERDNTIVVCSCGPHKRPHKAPNEVLVQHRLCSYQPNSKRKNKDTATEEIEAKSTNLISSCGFLEPFHQAPHNYLEQQQLYPNRPNTKRRKKETAKVDMVVEPVDKCTNDTTTLMTLKKVPFPVVETLNILEQPSVIVISDQQSPVLLRENRTSSSMTFLSSSGTFGSTHQTPCEILGQQQQSYDQANNKLIEQDTAKLENEGNGTTFLNSSWALELPHHFQEKLPELFGKLDNNKPDKKETARVESSMLTMTVTAHPPPNIAISQLNQCHPISAVQAQTLLPMPSFPTKKSKRVVCKYCGITQTLPSPQGVCNICGFKYKSGPSVNASERKSSDKAETPCPSDDGDRRKSIDRKCTHCGITRSPQWREGPLGLKTLCNACGVRYRSGRLFAEYRPLNSPTYSKELHSNSHRKVLELRKQKYGMVEKPVNEGKRKATTTASKKSKKDLLPACPAVNIFEQPIRSIITEQCSPVSVLENSTNSTTTQVSFCETLKQQLFCDQPNEKHIQQDTAKLENEMDSTRVMSSREALKRPHKAPNEVLVQHRLCGYQPNSQSKNKDTALVEIEVNSTTLISSCGICEPFHQAPYNYLEQQQLNQADNNRRKKDTAKVEMVVKPVNKCTNSSTTLMTLKKDLFPAVETSNILEQPSIIVISEQQIPVSVLENRTSSSTTLLSSSGTVDPPYQTPCDIVWQQQQSDDQGNNKLIEQDTAKVETEGNSSTFINSSWGLEPSHLPEKLQELFCMKANNKPDKKETARVESEGNFSTLMNSCGTLKPPDQLHKCLGQDQLFYKQAQETNKENGAIVEIRGKCQICGDKQSPHWLGGPLGSETLCHACGLAICKAKWQKGTAVEIENKCCPSPATGEFTTSTYTVPVLQDLFLSMNLSDIDIADFQKPFLSLENSPNDSTLMSFSRIKIPHRARTKGLRKRRKAIPEQQMGIEGKCLLCGKQAHRWQMGPFGAKTRCNACENRYQPLCGKSGVTANIANECQHCGSEETLQLLASPFRPKSLCNACYHWFKYGRWPSCNSSKSDPDKKASAEMERMPGMWW